MNSLKILISKLNTELKATLEKAVTTCQYRGHNNVELEHWLLSLTDESQYYFPAFFKEYLCDLTTITNNINQSLESLKTANDQSPAFSNRIIELINESWLIASLTNGNELISFPHIFKALIQNHTLSQICCGISKEFEKVSLEQFDSIAQKVEQSAPADQAQISAKTLGNNNTNIERFTINLNQQAKEGKIDEVIGREIEIRQTIDILSRRRQNNAILTGEPGVGKTAIAEGLALKIVNNEVPKSLYNVVILSLDIGLLQAGAGVKGEFENRLKSLINEIKQSPNPIILFIDEAHTLIGAGNSSGQNDAANLLKPALARGELRSIAATTWAEYKKYFEKDAALTRRFQVVKIEEPNLDTATNMLRSLKQILEKHHKVMILDQAIVAATELSKRYITGRQLPDKSISVLDTACARVASKQTTLPNILESNQQLLTQNKLELHILEAESKNGFEHQKQIKVLSKSIAALEALIQKQKSQWQKEKAIVSKINELINTKTKTRKSQLKKLNTTLNRLQNGEPLVQAFVDSQAVCEVIADWTGIPIGNMSTSLKEQALNIESILHQSIIGQDAAINNIATTIKTSTAGLSNPDKPRGVFLFVGPSGVGKTETATLLAEKLYGNSAKMTTINMSEFKEEHKVSLLAGSPPGYVGYGEGGVLTEAVRRKPYSLLLLDEMEKAHPGIQDAFYQVFDKGTMKDGQGRDIDFKNSLIIMTSNACSEKIAEYANNNEVSNKVLINEIYEELSHTFKPAFLGRVTIVPFLPLNIPVLNDIAVMKLLKIQKQVRKQYPLDLEFSELIPDVISKQCQQQQLGARQIDNIINGELLPNISEIILVNLENIKNIKKIQVDINKDGSFGYRVIQKLAAKEELIQ